MNRTKTALGVILIGLSSAASATELNNDTPLPTDTVVTATGCDDLLCQLSDMNISYFAKFTGDDLEYIQLVVDTDDTRSQVCDIDSDVKFKTFNSSELGECIE